MASTGHAAQRKVARGGRRQLLRRRAHAVPADQMDGLNGVSMFEEIDGVQERAALLPKSCPGGVLLVSSVCQARPAGQPPPELAASGKSRSGEQLHHRQRSNGRRISSRRSPRKGPKCGHCSSSSYKVESRERGEMACLRTDSCHPSLRFMLQPLAESCTASSS